MNGSDESSTALNHKDENSTEQGNVYHNKDEQGSSVNESDINQDTVCANDMLIVPEIRLDEDYDGDEEIIKKVNNITKRQEKKYKKYVGFDDTTEHDSVLESEIRWTGENKTSKEIRKVKDIAALLIESRETLRADRNVVDPIDNGQYIDSGKANEGAFVIAAHNVKIRRSNIIKAEKVKTQIGLKYLFIEKVYDWYVENGPFSQHAGLDGVYNPLQVIRNRKIRAKNNEKLAVFVVKTLPLPCNAFSSHNTRRKRWECTWAVTLDELFGDISWRNSHWGELVNSRGKLWCPDERSASGNSSNWKRRTSRLHDKIFMEQGSSSRRQSAFTTSSENSHIYADSEWEKDTASKFLGPFTRRSHTKRPSRDTQYSSFASSSSSNAIEEYDVGKESDSVKNYDPSASDSNMEEEVDNSQPGKLEMNPNESHSSVLLSSDRSINEKKGGSQEFVEYAEEDRARNLEQDSILRSPIKPLYSSNPNLNAEENEDKLWTENRKDISREHGEKLISSRVVQMDLTEQEVQKIFTTIKNFKHIGASLSSRIYYWSVLYPKVLENLGSRLTEVANVKVPQLCEKIVAIEKKEINDCNDMYASLFQESKSLMNMINEDYSVKVESLLSSSDRGISELNATLTSDYKRAEERLENIIHSMAEIDVISKSQSDLNKVKVLEKDRNVLLYFVLENLIVLTLRTVYVLVTFCRMVGFVFFAIVAVIRFVLNIFLK